jgi:nitrite reductase (NADH) small subunit
MSAVQFSSFWSVSYSPSSGDQKVDQQVDSRQFARYFKLINPDKSMVPASVKSPTVNQWITVCQLDQILPNSGVCALVLDKQVAIFRVLDEIYAIDNYDPFSKSYVLSRGIVGDRQGVPKVASPIYKQNFNLLTGECLDDPTVQIPVYPLRVLDGQVQVGV